MARITGDEAHRRRLRNIRGAAMIRQVGQAVFASAQDLAVDASLSITRGSVSGKNHVPSAPGEPPNADTQVLSRNIEATSTGPLTAEASSNAPYAAAQELGSQKLGLPERPYMRPAAERERPRATRRIVDAVNRVLRRNG